LSIQDILSSHWCKNSFLSFYAFHRAEDAYSISEIHAVIVERFVEPNFWLWKDSFW